MNRLATNFTRYCHSRHGSGVRDTKRERVKSVSAPRREVFFGTILDLWLLTLGERRGRREAVELELSYFEDDVLLLPITSVCHHYYIVLPPPPPTARAAVVLEAFLSASWFGSLAPRHQAFFIS